MSTTTERPTIPCAACHGTGHVTLSGVYAETLDLLRNQERPISGMDLARLAGCRLGTMSARLVELRHLGLARCERDGRRWLWTAVG